MSSPPRRKQRSEANIYDTAFALYNKNKLRSSYAFVEAGIVMSSNPFMFHHLKGMIFERLGDMENAESAARTSLDLAPENAHILARLAQVLLVRGKAREAVPLVNKARHLEPGNRVFVGLADMVNRGFDEEQLSQSLPENGFSTPRVTLVHNDSNVHKPLVQSKVASGYVELNNVCKYYGTREGPRMVLNNISFRVEAGEKIGILGLNGAGKSTLIRLISGAERPTSGSIDRQMRLSWPLAFGAGFQSSLTGYDNLKFICRIYDVDFKTAAPFVEEFSELGKSLREPIKTYSSGMFARLGFAISMAIEFDCFLIDEVIAVGDIRFREKCNVELFGKRKDRAMIMVSHVPELIREHCKSVFVLDKGIIERFEDVDQAYESYRSRH